MKKILTFAGDVVGQAMDLEIWIAENNIDTEIRFFPEGSVYKLTRGEAEHLAEISCSALELVGYIISTHQNK